jgi:hypothetical protein
MAPSGVALKVTVASGGGQGAGDYDADFHGPRNELLNSREPNGKIQYTEGDDRYFAWQTYFPDGSSKDEGNFPDPPPFCADDSCAPSGFNVFFQMHQEGVCGGPPISLGLVRADTVNDSGYASQNTGNVYHIVFNATDGQYTGDTPRLWPPMGHTEGIVKGGWYNFILHIGWSKNACQGDCNSPKNFNGGVLELWVKEPGRDWVYAWPGHGKSAAHSTAYDWPGSGDVCSADGSNVPRGGPMPQSLKFGLYRDTMLNNTATLFQHGLLAGTTCEAVNPGGCPPR